ncbi:Disease resistance protein RPM1 [Sesamum alatum]|uniref:Disease resistance protein RPM1 n=1 Tax=Sesamum alatum TaxID=300844 RepID=A0AAE2CZ00_9LAMI|nr:Disease resistance protein RPM1 [Sesamum alatum]
MAEIAVCLLVEKLSAWISKERELLGSLSGNAEFIRDEMGHIRAFLRVADQKQEVDPQLEEWIKQVRDIAYDAEDVMDKFMLWLAGCRRTDGVLGRIKQTYVSVKNLKARHQLASEMRAIRSRVQSISQGQQRYKDIYAYGTSESAPAWYDSRGDALLLEEAEVLGIKKPKKQLVEWLSSTDRTSGLKVISVVGTGGLGKTTLVRKVYDDAAVRLRFSTHVWITVSNSFKLHELLRTMIRRLAAEFNKQPPRGLEAMDADEMKEFVHKFLQNRTYIVVLDDIWSLSAWEAIRYAFPRSGTSGFIIITTRFQSIGRAASTETNGYLYNMQPLPQEESKTLFYRKAFLGGSCPSYLEEIADIVLKRCEGLPLAIVVIGSLLATKNNNIEEWNKFLRNLGDELEGDCLRRMTKLLSLSYYDLPYYLKSCFLYLSIFPEDHNIYMTRLIRLWIAEGFVQPKEAKTMEEVAEDYVKELLDRSLIQVCETPDYNMPVRIRVHDILHTMIVSKSKEQSFVTITNGGDTQWPARIRRLAIHGSIDNMADLGSHHHIRSVLVLDNNHPVSKLTLSKLLGSACGLLKVLELRGSLTGKIPDEVFKLYHLTYLGLNTTNVNSIPKSIQNLENLETLDLSDTKVAELPVEILRLRRLRHLLVYNSTIHRGYWPFDKEHSCKAPYRIGCLSSLQTLSHIEATQADDETRVVREIGKLTQLKKLGVTKLREEDGEDLCISLTKLTLLQSLLIASIDEEEIMDLQYPLSPAPPIRWLELRGRLLKVPEWVPSLQGLTGLHLRWSMINEDPTESLQHLLNLRFLELDLAYEGERLCFKSGGFQRLKKLLLVRLNGLKSVKIEEGSMPFLEALCVRGCRLLAEVLSGIEHLSHLQCIEFSDMSERFVEKLEKQKEEDGGEWKLARIPEIQIYSLINGEWQRRRL